MYLISGNNHDLPGTILNNNGIITHLAGAVRGGNGSAINNAGLWLEQAGGDFNHDYAGAAATFVNTGTFRKTASLESTRFLSGFVFNSSTLVDVRSGTVKVSGGGTGSGTFTTAANAACNFSASYTLNNGTILGGAVGVTLSGGTITLNGLCTASNLTLAGATVSGPGFLTFNGTNTWLGGVFDHLGGVTNSTGSTLLVTSGNNHDLPGATLINNGTIIHSGGAVRGGFGSVISNAGLWLEQTDNDINHAYGGSASTFANTGTFRKTADPGTTTFQGGFLLNNSSLIEVRSGMLDVGGGGANSGTFSVLANSACNFLASYSFNAGTVFAGAGTTFLNGGTATFNGGITSANLQWAAGLIAGTMTIADGSIFHVVSGNNHDFPGATINNNGTIIHTGGAIRGGGGSAISNGGTWDEQTDAEFNNAYNGANSTFLNLGSFLKSVTLGATTFQSGFDCDNSGRLNVQSGTVTFNGAYNHNGATLRFGLSSAVSAGHVNISGSVNLSGLLGADLLNGYVPASGDTFTPINHAAHVGVFTNFELPPLAAGRKWKVDYGIGGVSLRVVGPATTNTLQISGVVTNSQGNPVAGAAVFAFPDPNATNPVQNGSFELPSNCASQNLLYGSGSTNIPGWRVVGQPGANVAVQSAVIGASPEGVQYLDPSGATGGGGVTQTFPTVAGRSYTLVFFHGTASVQGLPSVLGVTVAWILMPLAKRPPAPGSIGGRNPYLLPRPPT